MIPPLPFIHNPFQGIVGCPRILQGELGVIVAGLPLHCLSFLSKQTFRFEIVVIRKQIIEQFFPNSHIFSFHQWGLSLPLNSRHLHKLFSLANMQLLDERVHARQMKAESCLEKARAGKSLATLSLKKLFINFSHVGTYIKNSFFYCWK